MDIYRIADLNILIRSLHGDVHSLCSDYRLADAAESCADIRVSVSQEDIDFERAASAREDEREGLPVRVFSDGYLETLAVYRAIAERLPFFDTVLFHGSCVAADGEGYLFAARSGVGKSTHARHWMEMLGGRAVMVNDDKPLIRVRGGRAYACGTPWDGKHRLSSRAVVPLRAICLLERAETNDIRRITPKEAYPALLQQVYRPAGEEAARRTLDLIDELSACVDLWKLRCTAGPAAAVIAYEAMKGDRK